jgi:hypothetical protein
MVCLRIFAFLLISFITSSVAAREVAAQAGGDEKLSEALRLAESHVVKGETCLASGNTECARREFDLAVDMILDLGVDVRADERLRVAYREIIERISRHEHTPAQSGGMLGWKTQDYDGRLEKPRAAETEIAGTLGPTDGPLTVAEFQKRFAILRDAFKEKYNRDITLTGADHGEHRRLYGRGSAYDIRTRDLTREQVNFIIARGATLGLRIKDFSTWEKVAAHNARTYALGRPLDTLATGVHLHIDRMTPSKKGRWTSQPATSKRSRKK